jgi:hypothetical protein
MCKTHLKITTGLLMTAFWLFFLYTPQVLSMVPFSDAEVITIPAFENDTIKMQDAEPLLDMQFDHPAMVAPGETFAFTIHLIKHPGFRPSGSITQLWPKGFLPQKSELEHGIMTVEDRRVEIRWDKLPRHGQVSFTYPVDVMHIKGSTYPVITEYRDVVGVNLNRTTGLHVLEGEKEEEVKLIGVQTSEPSSAYSLTADYPLEVTQENTFEMVFSVTKGKNVLPAELLIKLPPGFCPDPEFSLPHNFVQTSGMLVISWENMPASPVFDLPVRLFVAKPKHAVYPISAKFLINNEPVASFNKYVIVVKEAGQIIFPDTITRPAVSEVDTSSMFSELDAVLSEWIQQTSTDQPLSAEKDTFMMQDRTGGTDVDNFSQPAPDSGSGTDFRIQIFASVVSMPGLADRFRGMGIYEKLSEDYDGSMYRYTLGLFADKADANEYLRFLQSKGFTDAFVVRYVDGVRQN